MVTRSRLALLAALISVACGRAPAWVGLSAAQVDTIVVNSTRSIAMPHTLDPIRFLGRVSWQAAPAAIAHVTHPGAVACDTIGDATVTASTWFSRRTALLLCRPVRSFGFTSVQLRENGPAYKIVVPNWGPDGRPVTRLAGTARVGDTLVAVVRDGYLYPKALGKTWVHFDFTGMTTAIGVEVIDTVTTGAVTLADGEIRSWPLPHGRYEINVTPRAGSRRQPFALMIVNANCAEAEPDSQHYYCVTYTTGAVALRNGTAAGPHHERTANLLILHQGW